MFKYSKMIIVSAIIHKEIDKVWECWTEDQHVIQWNFTSPDWHCPVAANDLRIGGEFHYEIASKDGSVTFIFSGTYTDVQPNQKICFVLEDGRNVEVTFEKVDQSTRVTEKFEPEDENSFELQQQGWQAILDQFAQYVQEKAV
jgi:uncharacterized protein YndB with AHSA1/START domain